MAGLGSTERKSEKRRRPEEKTGPAFLPETSGEEKSEKRQYLRKLAGSAIAAAAGQGIPTSVSSLFPAPTTPQPKLPVIGVMKNLPEIEELYYHVSELLDPKDTLTLALLNRAAKQRYDEQFARCVKEMEEGKRCKELQWSGREEWNRCRFYCEPKMHKIHLDELKRIFLINPHTGVEINLRFGNMPVRTIVRVNENNMFILPQLQLFVPAKYEEKFRNSIRLYKETSMRLQPISFVAVSSFQNMWNILFHSLFHEIIENERDSKLFEKNVPKIMPALEPSYIINVEIRDSVDPNYPAQKTVVMEWGPREISDSYSIIELFLNWAESTAKPFTYGPGINYLSAEEDENEEDEEEEPPLFWQAAQDFNEVVNQEANQEEEVDEEVQEERASDRD